MTANEEVADAALIQALTDVVNALRDQGIAALAFGFSAEDLLGRSDGGIRGGGAHVGGGLRLGLCNLGLGHFRAASNEFFDLCLRVSGHPLGFGLSDGEDILRLAFRFLALAFIVGEELGCILAKLAGFIQLGLDAGCPIIERLGDRLVRAHVDKHAEEYDEGKRDPGFSLQEHPPSP
jgi:hypothetical protein